MTREKVYAEQIMIVTDEGENAPPYLKNAYAEYVQEMKVAPTVIIVQIGGAGPAFTRGLQESGIEATRYAFKGDLYSLPNLLPLLAMPSEAELVDLIMQYELPKRPNPVQVGVA
jgi:hypothetical protein